MTKAMALILLGLLLHLGIPPQPQATRLGTKVARLGATSQGHVGAGNRAFHLGCRSALGMSGSYKTHKNCSEQTHALQNAGVTGDGVHRSW